MTSNFRTIVGVVALMAVVAPSTAAARAVCGKRGPALRAEVASATAVFLARIEGPATPVGALPAGHRGVVDADVSVVVTRVFAGPVTVGETVTVRWKGWSEPSAGPIAGGCRVPATTTGERYPMEVLIIAHGTEGAMEVANDSTSQLVGAANRSLVRRVARLARRRR